MRSQISCDYTINRDCEYSKSFIARMHELNKESKNKLNIHFIEKGLAFAKHYHHGQFRKSGEPYVSHPIAVADMVANHMFRENPIIAALLHDTVEDTELTLGEIKREFNFRIAEMVDRLTRKIDSKTGKKMSAIECLIRAHELKDDEVVFIKECDRLHNIFTIEVFSEEKKKRIVKETISMQYFLIQKSIFKKTL